MDPNHLTNMKGNIQVPVKWVLIMLAVTVLAFSSISAAMPQLGQQMNALAVTIAGDVVCSQCVGTNGDGTNDIKDGSVTNAKIASSAVTNSKIGSGAVSASKIAAGAVTSSKIADGTIAYSDVSRAFVAVEHRDDCNCGGTGWDPDGTKKYAYIYDSRITRNSVLSVSLPGTYLDNFVCWAEAETSGFAMVGCNNFIGAGQGINYAIFTNPAYN